MYTMFLEDFTYPLEKEMATHSSILAWKTPWTEEPGRLQLWGRKELDMTDRLHFTFTFTRKGNEREGKFYTIKLLEKEVTNGVKQEQKS